MSTIKVSYDANDNIFTLTTKHVKFTFNNITAQWTRHYSQNQRFYGSGPDFCELAERHISVQHRQALRNYANKNNITLVNKNKSPKLDFVNMDLASVPPTTLYRNLMIIQDINKAILSLNRSEHHHPCSLREIGAWSRSLYVLASKLMVWSDGSPLIKIGKFSGLRVFFSREFPETHPIWSRLEVTKDYSETDI